jgi:hypothetical protein
MNTCAVQGIRLEQKTEYAPVSVNTARSVGLVVNEVLTNSFKYAFEGRGHGVITIECLRQSEDRYRVVIADDGVGLPERHYMADPGKDRRADRADLEGKRETGLQGRVRAEQGRSSDDERRSTGDCVITSCRPACGQFPG